MDNKQLLANVKAGFTQKHTSLAKWCLDNGIDRGNARKALYGKWKGKKGLALRQILIEKSGAEVHNLEGKVVNISCEHAGSVHNSQDVIL